MAYLRSVNMRRRSSVSRKYPFPAPLLSCGMELKSQVMRKCANVRKVSCSTRNRGHLAYSETATCRFGSSD